MADFLVKETVSEALDFLGEAPSLREVCSVLSQEVKKYSEMIIGYISSNN